MFILRWISAGGNAITKIAVIVMVRAVLMPVNAVLPIPEAHKEHKNN
jgi:hypothetical protein